MVAIFCFIVVYCINLYQSCISQINKSLKIKAIMNQITKQFRVAVVISILLSVWLPSFSHNFEVDGIYYNITDETAKNVAVTCKGDSYSDYSNEYTGSVVIPSSVTYNGTTYSVTSIEDYVFFECIGLTQVTIGNSVKSIGNYAFLYCDSLTQVTIGDSVAAIGKYAFYDCANLSKVNITDISAWCKISFDNYSANPIYYAHKLILNGEEVKDIVIPNDITEIKNYAFYSCTGLNSVTIPNSVTIIGNDAFRKCSDLIRVTIGDSVNKIGNHTFSGCTSLTSVTIPNSVTSIDEYAFSDCIGLKQATIGNSVTYIGDYAFCNCTGLTQLAIEDGIEILSLGCNSSGEGMSGKGLFYDCPLEKLYLGRNLSYNTGVKYGYSPFSKISTLKTLTIGNAVTTISNYAFVQCHGLIQVDIPNSITSIEKYAFNSCIELKRINITDLSAWCMIDFGSSSANPMHYAQKLILNGEEVKDLVIPNDITEVKNYAFFSCNGLNSVIIGNSVTKIGKSAFSNCFNLTTVSIGKSVEFIGSEAFVGIKSLARIYSNNTIPPTCEDESVFNDVDITKCELIVPEGYVEDYATTDIWCNFYNIKEAGIENVNIDQNNSEEIARYDIYGRQLTEPTKGINIIKMSDGSTRKEYVK